MFFSPAELIFIGTVALILGVAALVQLIRQRRRRAMTASPDHVAMHSVGDEDPLELAIFELLREHCGEEVGGTRSINASRALLVLLKIAAQLLAPYRDKDRAEWISAFRSGATHLNRRIYEKRAGSVP